MSVRLKSLSAAFAVSIALWAVLFQGAVLIYRMAPPELDLTMTDRIVTMRL